MIKNVLVNGCSFTFGHGDTEYAESGELMPPRDFVWPYQIKNLFKTQMIKTINVSKGGASNNRISRTTLEGVEKHKPDVVIVQWTSPFRSEWYDEIWQTYYGLIPTGNVKDSDKRFHEPLGMFGEPNVYIPVPKMRDYGYETEYYLNIKKASQMYQAYMMNHVEAMISFCKDVLLVQNYLDKRNIPYLFTSMSYACNLGRPLGATESLWDLIEADPLPYIAHLREEVDISKWTRYPFSAMMGDNIVSHDPYDPHPDFVGHELIAKELHKEIVKRELLKDN